MTYKLSQNAKLLIYKSNTQHFSEKNMFHSKPQHAKLVHENENYFWQHCAETSKVCLKTLVSFYFENYAIRIIRTWHVKSNVI